MEKLSFFKDFVVILLSAFIGGLAAKKFKLPLITGYLISGILVSLVFAKYIGLNGLIQNIIEVGVALLLFTLGLEFSLAKLKELGEIVIFGSLIQVLLSTLFGVLIFPFLGFDFYSSLFMGAAFSLSSTAAVLKILSDRGELETLHGEITAGWLFMQDLYTLPLIIILPTIGRLISGDNLGISAVFLFSKSIFAAFISFFLIILLGNKVIPYLFERTADLKSRELVLIAAVGICLLFAFVFNLLGISYAVGACVAGILLSSSSAKHGIFAEVRPLKDLFSTVFFVSLGFIISPVFIINHWFLILSLVILVIFSKIIISGVLVFWMGYHSKTATLVSLSLMSVGEFAFILAVLGINNSLISNEVYSFILSVTFISLVVTIPLTMAGDRIYYFLKIHIRNYFPSVIKYFQHADKSGEYDLNNLADHVVVLGHGRVGKYICKALTDSGIPFVVIDYNHHLVKLLRQGGVNVIYGDPAEIDVLRFAMVERAKVVIIAYADRHTQELVITNIITLNPSVKIIARVHFEQDSRKLKSLGVTTIVQPEFEAAISMSESVLKYILKDYKAVVEKISEIRKEHGYL